jgi:LysR family transcriptional activator of nhaA
MDWLNYHHLLYFWVVASEGSVTAACERLQLAQPTISSQLRKLEKSIGGKLFERSGRNLVLSVLGAPKRARSVRRKFPNSLDGEKVLLPTRNAVLRRSLDQWFDDHDIHPAVVAEIQDSALTKTFGQAGVGLFFAPSAIEKEIRRQFDVEAVGRLDEVTERFYAVSLERRIKHPAVGEISKEARRELFG